MRRKMVKSIIRPALPTKINDITHNASISPMRCPALQQRIRIKYDDSYCNMFRFTKHAIRGHYLTHRRQCEFGLLLS